MATTGLGQGQTPYAAAHSDGTAQHPNHLSAPGTDNPRSDRPPSGHTLVEMPSPDEKEAQKPEAQSQHPVDVEEGEKLWGAMKKRVGTLKLVGGAKQDEEKLGEDRDDEFDIEEVMRGTLQRRDEAGLRRKMLGVYWEDLRVIGAGGMKLPIRGFHSAVIEFVLSPVISVLKRVPGTPFHPKPKDILTKFDGVARAGEMVLVLGRPGSGCSTFLKVIGNQRVGYLGIDGTVCYGGLDSKAIRKQYTGEVVYNPEDDQHNPTLTVEQTLMFALTNKTPARKTRVGWVSPEEAEKEKEAGEFQKAVKDDYREDIKNTILRMLNIDHTRHTLVGSEFVRGISGGERKRVSIAEMMTTNASVCAWDNSTRGLDAATAIDYAKSLRLLTNVFHTTTFVSLYQAGEDIYRQFDKVLVLDKGHQVYYGPASDARKYFIDLGFRDLPRQTTADYLTGCTDENERQFAEGRDASSVPSTSEELEATYRASDTYKNMLRERDEYKSFLERENPHLADFQEAVASEKRRGVSKKSPYTVSFSSQVWALTKRQFTLKLQDKLELFVQFTTAIIVAIVAGTLFRDLPQTAAGAFTRGGVLFLALLFNSFQAFNELPTQMMGRGIMWRQSRNFAFYRPGALSLATVFAELPLSSLQVMLFSMIIYLLAGLVRNAGAFFTFYALAYATFMALSALFRLLGSLCQSYDQAGRLATAIIMLMVIYSGYLIPVFAQQRWLFWLYFVNPLQYGFSGVMANEFRRISLTCDGANIVPNSLGGTLSQYPTELGENQVCTLQGAEPGNPVVSGSAYISAAFRYSASQDWSHFGYVMAFWALFISLQMACQEFLKYGAGMAEITLYLPENGKRKELNAALAESREKSRKGEVEQDLSGLINSRKPFTWENLCYSVPVSGGQRQLLDNVFGYVKPGTLTALMGASGAGKTTLLDVLAQRKNIGVITGDILIDGKPIGDDFGRGTAYAEQQDVHEGTATVREALRFSAYLRQPADVSRAEKDRYVEEVIQLLEMEDIADAMIGNQFVGLSVEARKRVTIGVELAAKPQLLLFLDEPTSGLDGQSAYNVVRFLRKLAAAGQAILCTIHQPNSLLFENFDRLLLLKKGGRTVYFGDIGKDSKVIREYFAENGAECPPDANMAEKMLDFIGAGTQKRVGDRDWADIWLDSRQFAQVKEDITSIKREASSKPADENAEAITTYAAPFLTQLEVVTKRAFVSFWRSPDYCFTRLLNHIVVALITGLTFLNLGDGTADLQYRIFAIFIATILPALIITQVEPQYIQARTIFIRENSSRMYSPWVFALGQLMAETPYSVLCAVCFYLLWYFPVGFDTTPNRAGYSFLMIFILEFFSVTLGQAVGALSPSVFIAESLNPFLLLVFSLFCGVTIPKPNMPGFWRSWMYQLDPFTRVISGLLSTELQGLRITCNDDEFRLIQPPQGQTCDAWIGPYTSAAGGYVDNPGDSADCRYCQYREGQDFLRGLEISFGDRWRDLGIFIAFTIFNVGVTLVAARFLRYARR